MSIKKILSLNKGGGGGSASLKKETSSKRRKPNTRSSFQEISIQRGKSLKDMNSDELKTKIKRWAKAVVAYARQVSGKFGSSRRVDDRSDSKSSGSCSRVHEDNTSGKLQPR
ncbi:hypothetical protein EZV62_003605 [Acer yangbiense]|uniref:Uncharacterized protein n=1 Tax=Acer yangbiense TaxID=1000413 RepID=A0A5C7GQB0_9ROSI|nr:hypothetical protein EZV62_028096 [Acer yangbiense]TXG68670.1 hypothetical protein EZV62_003605 [Acer yangbiense]